MICTESKDDYHTFVRTGETYYEGSVELSVFKCKCGKRVDFQSTTVKGRDKI